MQFRSVKENQERNGYRVYGYISRTFFLCTARE
jgi:hypothetical protein